MRSFGNSFVHFHNILIVMCSILATSSNAFSSCGRTVNRIVRKHRHCGCHMNTTLMYHSPSRRSGWDSGMRKAFSSIRQDIRVSCGKPRVRCYSQLQASSPESPASSSSSNNDGDRTVLHLRIPQSDDMEEIGGLLSTMTLAEGVHAAAGQVIFLQGDLGAGKTALARGFLRAATEQCTLQVTSPTYLLSNSYAGWVNKDEAFIDIHHMDLYRLPGLKEQEFAPLDLDRVFAQCVSLIEWPGRLPGSLVPDDRLEITIHLATPQENEFKENEDGSIIDTTMRLVTMNPFGRAWTARIRHIYEEGYLDDLVDEESSTDFSI